MHIRALIAAFIVPLFGLLAAPVHLVLAAGRGIAVVMQAGLPDLVLAGPDEVALQGARRAFGWGLTELGRRMRAFLVRALTHQRYRAGMFAIGDCGGPQQLAV